MKKYLCCFILLALAMSAVAQTNHYLFSETVESGQTLYFLKGTDDPYELTVTYPCQNGTNNFYYGYDKPVGNLIIPSTITHNDTVYTITRIGNRAFYQCFDITSVSLPNSLNQIGDYAFYNCIGITSVVLGNNINSIGKETFVLCTALEHISELPETLTTLKQDAFKACTSLSGTITIPPLLTTVEEGVFYNCNINSIVFSEGVETIKSEAFCRNPLVSIHIPSTLTNISSSGFSCWGNPNPTLESIVVDDANPVYDSRNNCNSLIKTATNTLLMGSNNAFIPYGITVIGSKAFQHLNIDAITMPNTVERIEETAFFGCDNIITITIPPSVNYIGTGALGCSSLTSITCESLTPPTAFYDEWEYGYENSFDGVNSSIPVYIPFGTSELYHTAPGWNYFTNFIESEMNLEGEWYYEIKNDDGSITYQYLQCEGDTTINNERPKIIVRTNTIYDKDKKTEVTHEYVYENNGIVYWWNKELQQFTILYDLTAEEGDEWEIKVGTETLLMHVDGVEAYEHDGETYKMLHVSDAGQIFTGDIVVGIGHLTSFFPERLMNKNKDFRVDGLRCYWVGDALLYHQGDEDCDVIYSNFHGVDEINTEGFRVYPNPTDGLLYIVETQNFASLPLEYRITNLMGQTLMTGTLSEGTIDVSDLPKGMYFVAINNQSLKFVKL